MVRSGSGDDELNVTWSLIGVSPQAVGVPAQHPAKRPRTPSRRVSVHWYDRIGSRLLTPRTCSGRRLGRLPGSARPGLCTGDQLASGGEEFDRLAATDALGITFAPDGGAVVLVGHPGTSRDISRAVVSAHELGPWLSAAGRNAQSAATDPQPLPPPVVDRADRVTDPADADREAARRETVGQEVSHPEGARPQAAREATPRVDCARQALRGR